MTSLRCFARGACRLPPSAPSAASRLRRILNELTAYAKKPHPYIEVFPCDDNVGLWKVLLEGPEHTAFETGLYLLYVSFPEQYPIQAPEIRFMTPIYHCNVNAASGRICHPLFDRDYSASLSMNNLLSAVYGLLMEPEPGDPLVC